MSKLKMPLSIAMALKEKGWVFEEYEDCSSEWVHFTLGHFDTWQEIVCKLIENQ